MTFKVSLDGGEGFKVVAGTRDVVVWERATKKSFRSLMEDMFMADLYKLAHIAANRQQLFTGNLQEFEASVDLEFDADEEEADPTRPAR